jgi:hypothetical protein
MIYLKQSTAVDIPLGPFVDSTDGSTAETALTISQADVRLKKNGGAWAQKNQASSASHEENGWYEVSLDATDTNTLGLMKIAVHEAGALPVFLDAIVMPANVYESLIAGTEFLSTTGLQADFAISGSTLTVKKTDGTTTQYTKTITTSAGADPIVGLD